jgi:ADP-ribosylglycohydrolase
MSLPPDYAERVYAGWLGKCIGVRYGAPLEGLTYCEINRLFGELAGYVQAASRVFHPDDDLNGPMLFLRTLDDYGDDPPAPRFGDTWLNYIADGRGTLWWGGYGISTEHTAYTNLLAGIPAPLSGSIALNGATVAEQIGGQIFSDCWGLICPNNPERAAELAARASSVSHDGNGIYGGMFIAAAVAAAFSAHTPQQIIERALTVIPAECTYAQVTREVMAFHAAHPRDWRSCYEWIKINHGYQRYPGHVPIIPNAAVIIMGLLYGDGDFSKALHITNMGGWDTDCNVGNVGCIMGVLVGLAGIPFSWRQPFNDMFVLASLTGSKNIMDMASAADHLVRHGYRQAGLPDPPRKARYHFEYPGSVQGFLPLAAGAPFVAVQQTRETGRGCLKIIAKGVFRRRNFGSYVRTYLRPEELDGNAYKATFSPTIYPGQTMSAQVMVPADAPATLYACLFVHDGNSGERLDSPAVLLKPGQWQHLEWRIPPRTGACLDQAGVFITPMHQQSDRWSGAVYLDDFDWGGPPSFAYDFSRERMETEASSQWTFLRGIWRLEKGSYVGSGAGQNETYSGNGDWTDYALTVRLRPLLGDSHLILGRVQGALRSYAVGLAPGRLVLFKNDKGYREVAATPLVWELGQVYELRLTVRGAHIEGTCGGQTVAWDDDQPYTHGAIGLANGRACRTEFMHVAVEGLSS